MKKKKVQPGTFPKRLFLFPLMKASRAGTDGQMLFEWNFLRLSPFIHTCKGRIKFLFCGAKKGEGGGAVWVYPCSPQRSSDQEYFGSPPPTPLDWRSPWPLTCKYSRKYCIKLTSSCHEAPVWSHFCAIGSAECRHEHQNMTKMGEGFSNRRDHMTFHRLSPPTTRLAWL